MEGKIMICVAGRAGDGSYSMTNILSRVFHSLGFYVHEQRDIYSNIKSRPSAFCNITSNAPVWSRLDAYDVLVAFDAESLRERISELKDGAVCILDSSARNPAPGGVPVILIDEERAYFTQRKIRVYEVPMADLARTRFKEPIIRNMIGAGVAARLLNIPRVAVVDFIQRSFGGKRRGEELVRQNLEAFDLGNEQAAQWPPVLWSDTPSPQSSRLFLLGNEAMAFGALAGGCRFFAGYPITPSAEIFEYLMAHIQELGGIAIQAASELEAVNLVVGAAYAGARSMTATAGPGFSLMQEAISGAGIAETPLVIALIQRGGPGTGLPTRTSQEDLMEAAFGGHGEFPRIILSPSTPEECFLFGAQAFNLAERYQCLVILLSEQCVGQAYYTVDSLPLDKVTIDRGKILSPQEIDEMRKVSTILPRYAHSADGISPRAFPGTPGITVMSNSNEHDEEGYSIESKAVRIAQVTKRLKKTKTMLQDGALPAPILVGDLDAEIAFIGYGGVLGPIWDAMSELAEKGVTSKFLRLRTIWPLPVSQIKSFVHSAKRIYVVEQNATGQLKSLIQMQVTGPLPKLRSLLRFDGMPFTPSDIVSEVLK